MKNLDKQLYQFKERLICDIGVEEKYLSVICTTIYAELSNLNNDELLKIELVSPVTIEKRIEELKAFNMMMDRVNYSDLKKYPEIIRSQVIVQNYISFVYLKDNCFDVTKNVISSGTLTRRICKFLLDNPVRAFRNSIAHGNWQYTFNPSGIIYFAHKGDIKQNEKSEVMIEFIVFQDELNFWQALSRATAYTIYTYILEHKKT
jgi:hypothetical protein